MALGLNVERCFPADTTIVCWRGHRFADPNEFDVFLRGPVRERVTDAAFEQGFGEEITALATTDMASETLKAILGASPPPLDWEIGEAMAECLLQGEFNVVWPWNENRDRKTPRASLPGADLVGFLGSGDDTVLLFGEVKTSSDVNSPPGVLNGRSGMIHQIDELASSVAIQGALIRWLHARCANTEHQAAFHTAMTRFLESKGKDIALVGVLLRDTPPNLDDLRTRGTKFELTKDQKPKIRLDAWYAPRKITEWVATMSAEA